MDLVFVHRVLPFRSGSLRACRHPCCRVAPSIAMCATRGGTQLARLIGVIYCMERAMKRFLLAGIVVIAATTSGCIGGNPGPAAVVRETAEQTEINRAYTEEVMAKQGMSSSAVGATTGSGSGVVGSEYWRY